MTTKPVLIEYTKGPLKGERFVVTSAAKAREVHPDARIISFEDGSKFTEPKSAPAKADDKKE